MSSQALPAKAEPLFRYLFEQSSLGIAVEDLNGKILLANPALCSMLGYSEDELAGMTCSQFANPEDSQDDWALFQKLREGAIDHYTLEKRYVTKQGVPLWGRLNVSLLRTGGGGISAGFCLCGGHHQAQSGGGCAAGKRAAVASGDTGRKNVCI